MPAPGSDAVLGWLLGRGYQVTGKVKAGQRVRKLTRPIHASAWTPTTSPGREVAVVPEPVRLARPTCQYAVRTPSRDRPDGFYYAVLVTTRAELTAQGVVDHDDQRAGMEADRKADKHGLGLGVWRKRKLAAQELVVLLAAWAHNLLLWARSWLAPAAPRLAGFGIVRLLGQVWALPGRVRMTAEAPWELRRIRLDPLHPCAHEVACGLQLLLTPSKTAVCLG